MAEKRFITIAKIDDEEVFRSIEEVSIEIADHQDQMIKQMFVEEIDRIFGNKFHAITLDEKKLGRALSNAMPARPCRFPNDSGSYCGLCGTEIKVSYCYCPSCGKAILWNSKAKNK